MDMMNVKEKKTEGKKRRNQIVPIPHPDRVMSYIKAEKPIIALIVCGGTFFNAGMTAGPYFEGRLAQCLYECINGTKTYQDMLALAALYLAVIFFVQAMRCLKRFAGRRLKNNMSRNMRHMLYNGVVHMSREEIAREDIGAMMTKAVSDVDACVNGMGNVTTEIFDTGVLLLSYLAMLFYYDWRLTLLSCAFIPIAYAISMSMRRWVIRYNEVYKRTTGELNRETMDRVENALTYRVYGREENRDASYEKILTKYEKSAVAANLLGSGMQPIYTILSMGGVLFIIWFGGKNVMGQGWTVWDIGAFTAFLACFTKMAQKASRTARLFNAVQRARVSWVRIKPLLKEYIAAPGEPERLPETKRLTVDIAEAGFEEISDYRSVLHRIRFSAEKGQIIGVTGAIASGKSALGKAFIGDARYEGSITLDGVELNTLDDVEKSRRISYMGHDPELMSDSIRENVLLGKDAEFVDFLKMTRMDGEVGQMPKGGETFVGSGGEQLSGGQQARLALARILCHAKSILILDDPFSAVDKRTEREIFSCLQEFASDRIVLLISHRLALFPETDGVLFLHQGEGRFGTHKQLLKECPEYAMLYRAQETGGGRNEE